MQARLIAERAPAVADALDAARLRFGTDRRPGLARRGRPGEFAYVDAAGREVDDPRALQRIASLAIPPAWTDVWICADPAGHLQATGRDARGRKQYRYHPRWRAVRDETKFARLAAFARALPALRRTVARDLARPGLPRDKVLAAMVALLDRTAVRVGDERYRRDNGTFGLTTLRNRHVEVEGERLRLRFRGKGGKEHDIRLDDGRLVRIVRRCRDLPGYELFQYVEGGEVRSIDAADVNAYLRAAGQDDYTAKDFRTWHATVIAVRCIARADDARCVPEAVRQAAAALGNTAAVCRRSYVHPDALDRDLVAAVAARRPARVPGLSADEARALAVLGERARTLKRTA